jgi:hypothetical protein
MALKHRSISHKGREKAMDRMDRKKKGARKIYGRRSKLDVRNADG